MQGQRMTIYLPSRDKNGNEIEDIDYWVDEACALFCGMNGGATYLIGFGVYQTKAGMLIRERTHVIYSIAGTAETAIANLLAFLDRFGSVTEQEVVMYEIGQAHFFYTPRGNHHGHLFTNARAQTQPSAAAEV